MMVDSPVYPRFRWWDWQGRRGRRIWGNGSVEDGWREKWGRKIFYVCHIRKISSPFPLLLSLKKPRASNLLLPNSNLILPVNQICGIKGQKKSPAEHAVNNTMGIKNLDEHSLANHNWPHHQHKHSIRPLHSLFYTYV